MRALRLLVTNRAVLLRVSHERVADDHDYGVNDADESLPWKAESRQLFWDFWQQATPAMRTHAAKSRDEIYLSHVIGTGNNSVRILVLDTRWSRSSFSEGNKHWDETYTPDPKARILSDAQWEWLDRELQKPAGMRIIASSTQVLRDANGAEAWANFPTEQQRLVAMIPKGVPSLIVSGDVHYSDLSCWPSQGLCDITSSGLTETWRAPHPNAYRSDPASVVMEPNFGLVTVDFDAQEVEVRIKDEANVSQFVKRLSFAEITPK